MTPLGVGPAGPRLHLGPVHRLVLPVHLRAAGLDGPQDGGARQPHRGGRDGDRGDGDAADPGDRQLGPDRARGRARHGGRHPRRAQRADDGDAADGRAVQRRRRRRRRADRLGGVPHAATASPTIRPTWRSSASSRRSSDRSASGARTSRSPSCRSCCPGGRSPSGRPSSSSTSPCCSSALGCAAGDRRRRRQRAADDRPAAGRGAAGQLRGAADRRRRHAGGHQPAQRAHGPVGRGDRHRAQQHRR